MKKNVFYIWVWSKITFMDIVKSVFKKYFSQKKRIKENIGDKTSTDKLVRGHVQTFQTNPFGFWKYWDHFVVGILNLLFLLLSH